VNASEIRATFLDFFKERGHKVVPASSLIPEHPRAPLLTTAGMVQFIPYLTGEKPAEFPRAASCQPSARTTDIEAVGLDARHQTLFEMLGNFSFGDYYKQEAIVWAWELATGDFGLDPEQMWVSIYVDDDEAFDVWTRVVGVSKSRVVRCGKDDNFWWMGVAGPGGPCTELYFDRGPDYGPGDGFEPGDRVLEFYNLVFTESQVDDRGEIVGALPQKNVDTGMGLERMAQILQDVPTAYETDTFRPILRRAKELTGRAYGEDEATDVSLRIITEHARAATFLIADGIMPSNEDRGYVLRRLLRRAVRRAKLLGVDDLVLPAMVESVVGTLGEAYPNLAAGKAFITQVVTGEEEAFRETLRYGLAILTNEMDAVKKAGASTIGGSVAFKLHDTYGFPRELTVEIAQEAGLEVDAERFEELMNEQRERARAAHKVDAVDEAALREILAGHGASTFLGYELDEAEGKVRGIVLDGELHASAGPGAEIELVLDATPFYPEGGGQVGDTGVIESEGARLEVLDTQRRLDDLIVHRARVTEGSIGVGERARALVDAGRRRSIQRSHTATHVLHATLRAALGEHARQYGSLVEPGRLRFDFAHNDRVPQEVLAQVERAVNDHVGQDDLVKPYETTMDEARSRGAIMLFEEKYGEIVRVVEIGAYSIELCGGTHVTHTSQVGAVKVLGEGSISSGVRRVEALTGAEALEGWRRSEAVLHHVASILKTTPEEAPARVERLLEELKDASQARKRAQAAASGKHASQLAAAAEQVGGTGVVIAEVPGLAGGDLQKLAAAVRGEPGGPAVVILASASDGKAAVVAVIGDEVAARGIRAPDLVRDAARAIGGGAGGRDQSAIGGGKNVDAIAEALRLARAAVEDALR